MACEVAPQSNPKCSATSKHRKHENCWKLKKKILGHGSSGRMPNEQAQSLEFKSQYHQKILKATRKKVIMHERTKIKVIIHFLCETIWVGQQWSRKCWEKKWTEKKPDRNL
jgi:hypothetical protein